MNILITGASKGIGKAIALAFSKEKCHKLFLISRDEKRLEDVKSLCISKYPDNEVFVFPFDFNDSKDLNGLVSKIINQAGTIDILINNAGSLFNKKFMDLTDEEIAGMFMVNFFNPARIIRQLIPALEKSKKAHVINIGSMGGFQGSSKFPGLSYYSASKAAIAVLTECLAIEFKNSDISFNCLALGAVETDMFNEAFPGAKASFSPEEMAEFIVNFAKRGHLKMNGKIIPITSKSSFEDY